MQKSVDAAGKLNAFLDERLRESLYLLGLAAACICFGFATFEIPFGATPPRWGMVVVTGSAGLVALTAALRVRSPIAQPLLDAAGVGAAAFLILAAVANAWIGGHAIGLAYVGLICVAVGAAFVRPWQLYLLSGLGVVSMIAAHSRDWDGSLAGVTLLNLISIAVGVAIFHARLQLLRSMALAQLAEQQAREELHRLAMHDPLTGLANRRALLEETERRISRSRRHPERTFALCFLDLDGFKTINDSCGHATGDRLLIEIAGLLRKLHRREDLIARLGGDEFVVILDEAPNPESAERASARIVREIEALSAAFDCCPEGISVSAGVAWSGSGYSSPQQMLDAADVAMYREKRAGAKAISASSSRQ